MKKSKFINIAAVGVAIVFALSGCGAGEVNNLNDAAPPDDNKAPAAYASEDINKQDEDGMTPLHRVADEGNLKVVIALIKAGGYVNAVSNKGWTPLHFAANREIVAALVEAGADVNARDSHGWTPLHWNVLYGYKDIAEELVKAGAFMNARTNDKRTPVDFLQSCNRREDVKDKQKHLENCQATVDFLRQKGGVCINAC